MKYRVEMLDYSLIVREMKEKGPLFAYNFLEEKYLNGFKPIWKNEIIYFWRSLYNTALLCDGEVWEWLCDFHKVIAPCFPSDEECLKILEKEKQFPLPKIGDSNDGLINKNLRLNPSDPTEKNFVEQSRYLNDKIEKAFEKGETKTKDLHDFVRLCVHGNRISGRHLIGIFIGEKCPALSTDEGLMWLKKMFPRS